MRATHEVTIDSQIFHLCADQHQRVLQFITDPLPAVYDMSSTDDPSAENVGTAEVAPPPDYEPPEEQIQPGPPTIGKRVRKTLRLSG